MIATGTAIAVVSARLMLRLASEFFSAVRDTINANRAYEHWQSAQEYGFHIGSRYFVLQTKEARKYVWSCYVHQVKLMQNCIDNIEDDRFRDQVMLELYS